ncbi:MAG: hypothetical protein M3327_02665 [Actinomycetota bacterium]|nr:hypothetical protein [Actinomycetota bacterium]
MASLSAAARGRIAPAGIITITGVNDASGYHFAPRQIRRIGGAKLFVSSEEDVYGGAEAARQWYRWASPRKRIEILSGYEHGTDLLARGTTGGTRARRSSPNGVRTVNEVAESRRRRPQFHGPARTRTCSRTLARIAFDAD